MEIIPRPLWGETLLLETITKKERNFAIVEAIEDGYKQVEIADFLNISSSAVSKIISEKSGNS